MKKVLVLTEGDTLDVLSGLPLNDFDAVFLAFWASPEFAVRLGEHGAKECWRLNEVVSDYPALIARAFEFAHFVAERMPPYRDVNPWRAWENVIATAMLIPQVAAAMLGAIAMQQGAGAEIYFLACNDMQRAFEIINRHRTICFEIKVLVRPQSLKYWRGGRRLGAWAQLVGEARQDGDWKNLITVPIESLDTKYRWRVKLSRSTKATPGNVLCYSSYENYSRVLAKHAGKFGSNPEWVVNSHSARKGLPKRTQAWDLWRFGKLWSENHGTILAGQRTVLEDCPDSFQGLPMRALLAASAVIQETAERVMPRLLSEIDLMTQAVAQLEPREIWVANQWGGEGCLVQVAHAQGIAVTQVQHGVLEPYFACAPVYTDTFFVWSEFWRDAVATETRAKVQVEAGNAKPMVRRERTDGKPQVTFFTTPPDITPFWNPSVAAWEIVTLLTGLARSGYAVTLRAHPMDLIGRYQALCEGDGKIQLRWDKGTPLAERIAETDAACMMFSTTLLDCVANGIPVTGLGWYDFIWKDAVRQAGYMRFGDSLDAVAQGVSERI